MEQQKRSPMKMQLILAGISEIEENGIQNFSMRRIATRCGVSCAAPYKHFEDKHEFLMEIISYINEEWQGILHQIIITNEGGLKELIIEICVAYIRFLLDNPHFRSVIMLKDVDMMEDFKKAKTAVSDVSNDIIGRYCKSVNMPYKTRMRKQYVVRSLIYGAAILMDNGEIEYNEDFMEQVRMVISREFDIE